MRRNCSELLILCTFLLFPPPSPLQPNFWHAIKLIPSCMLLQIRYPLVWSKARAKDSDRGIFFPCKLCIFVPFSPLSICLAGTCTRARNYFFLEPGWRIQFFFELLLFLLGVCFAFCQSDNTSHRRRKESAAAPHSSWRHTRQTAYDDDDEDLGEKSGSPSCHSQSGV